jgi:hypothetical protein
MGGPRRTHGWSFEVPDGFVPSCPRPYLTYTNLHTGTKRTIALEDQFLKEFRRTMIVRYRQTSRVLPSADPQSDANDDILFNQPPEDLEKDIIFCIQQWIQAVQTPANFSTRPKVSDAMKRGKVLVAWTGRKRRRDNPVSYKRMNSEIPKGYT